MSKYDKSWSDLNNAHDYVCVRPYAPRGVPQAKRSLVGRIVKALRLLVSGKCRLSTVWQVAGCV